MTSEFDSKIQALLQLQEELYAKINNLENKVSSLNAKIDYDRIKLIVQQNEIYRLSKVEERILNNLNHELRLSVGSVISFAQMARAGFDHYDLDQSKILLDEVYYNANRLSTMILNMLDLATLEVKKQEVKKEKINLSTLLRERLESCQKIYLEDKDIGFKTKIKNNIIATLDKNYMAQVLDNLISNAIRFSHTGTIHVNLKEEFDQIIFTVTDEGKGIPAEDLVDIFRPFQVASNNLSKAEGRGIGLALCKAAIEAHGGSIKAKSLPLGTMFQFVISTKDQKVNL